LSRKAYHLGGQKLQIPILCALCRAHLEEGLNISDYDVLADIAEEVGMMTKEEALAFLNSDELVDEVEKLCEDAKTKGIPGVPFTVIDNRWAVSGGQSSEVFVQVCTFRTSECSRVLTRSVQKIFKKLNDAAQHVPYLPGSSQVKVCQPI
jgi:predicted DsbA family dithiol-disulfide isomerase